MKREQWSFILYRKDRERGLVRQLMKENGRPETRREGESAAEDDDQSSDRALNTRAPGGREREGTESRRVPDHVSDMLGPQLGSGTGSDPGLSFFSFP